MEGNNSNDKKGQYILVNILEEFVRLQVQDSIKELGACDCEKCYLDACALALNSLEPKYVTTKKGVLLSELTVQLDDQTNILIAVTKAVMQVKAAPQH